jgi:hypothetical protein
MSAGATAFSLFVRNTSTANQQILRTDSAANGMLFRANDSSNDRFLVYVSGSYRVAQATASAIGTWAALCGTYDGSTVRLYRDATEIASTAFTGTIANNATAYSIGGRSDGAEYMNGLVACTFLWTRALTPTEIRSVTLNPWQIFRAPSRRLWVPSGAAPPSTDGYVKVWNGSAWVAKPLKVWNGSSWVQKPVKHWNGSSWVLSNGS